VFFATTEFDSLFKRKTFFVEKLKQVTDLKMNYYLTLFKSLWKCGAVGKRKV